MVIQKIKKPVNIFIKALPKTIKPTQVILFGSQVDGRASVDSDIDVIVVSKDFENVNEDNRLDVLYKASRFIYPEIHPWGVTPSELMKADSQSTLGNARNFGVQLIN